MSVTHQDILVCATALQSRATESEATARAALARAYYAAYHECTAWHAALPAPGRVPTNTPRGVHAELAARLQNPDPSTPQPKQLTSRKRGARLRALHGDRVRADYELKALVSVADARRALQEATDIAALQ